MVIPLMVASQKSYLIYWYYDKQLIIETNGSRCRYLETSYVFTRRRGYVILYIYM